MPEDYKTQARDKNEGRKLHLGARMAALVFAVCVIMSVISLALATNIFYSKEMDKSLLESSNLAQSVSFLLNQERMKELIHRVRQIYDNAPEDLLESYEIDELGSARSVSGGAFEALFRSVAEEKDYQAFEEILNDSARSFEVAEVSIFFVDAERNRQVYVLNGVWKDIVPKTASVARGLYDVEDMPPGAWTEMDDAVDLTTMDEDAGYYRRYYKSGWDVECLQYIAPLRIGSEGELIAYVGVDSIMQWVREERDDFLRSFLLVQGIATVISVLLSQLVLRYFIERPLRKLAAEQERLSAELDVAARIQETMQPRAIEGYEGAPLPGISARIKPAREVGGDFYDYFSIDDDHIGIAIGDVVGKGVPACLFMSITQTLIRYSAENLRTPGDIFRRVNNSLCENNLENMFVTVWIGIYELSTGRLVYANAGHEYPVVYRKQEGAWRVVEEEHDTPLGIMEEMEFAERTIALSPGDKLYVYTDGIPEATARDGEMFGMERMLESLGRHREAAGAEILEGLWGDVDAFVGAAPQFDDMTMLLLEVGH